MDRKENLRYLYNSFANLTQNLIKSNDIGSTEMAVKSILGNAMLQGKTWVLFWFLEYCDYAKDIRTIISCDYLSIFYITLSTWKIVATTLQTFQSLITQLLVMLLSQLTLALLLTINSWVHLLDVTHLLGLTPIDQLYFCYW